MSLFKRFRGTIAQAAALTVFILGISRFAAAQSLTTVVSAATMQSTVAPESWAFLLGHDFADAPQTSSDGPHQQFAGVQVTIAGLPAQVFYVSPDRIGIAVPSGVPMGKQPVVLTVQGVQRNAFVNIAAVAPGIFQLQTLRRDRAIAASTVTGGNEPFPMPPAGGQSRLTLLGTGWRFGQYLSVNAKLIDGLLTVPLSVVQSGDGGYPGLDAMQVILPDALKNAGLVAVTIEAGSSVDSISVSNSVTIQTGEFAFDVPAAPGFFIQAAAGTSTGGNIVDGGSALTASLQGPASVALDQAHNLYIADSSNHVVRKVSAAGTISTFAGTGAAGDSGDRGAATSAQFKNPVGVAVDRLGNVYIADAASNRIRMVDGQGNIRTVAGNGNPGFGGDGDLAAFSSLNAPSAIVADRFGNLYIADTGNHRIREITGGDGKIHTLAGTGIAGNSGNGGLATVARLNSPGAVAVDGEGTVYFADSLGLYVRAVDPDGVIRLIAGTGESNDTGDGAAPSSATFRGPVGLAVDRLARLWIADSGSHRVRMIGLDNAIHGIAGTGHQNDSGDGAPATGAELRTPTGLVGDAAGNMFVADIDTKRVRILTSAPNCAGNPTVSFVPPLVVGGQKVNGYLQAPCPASADVVFAVHTDFPGVTGPANVTLHSGDSVAAFSLLTSEAVATERAIVSLTSTPWNADGSFVVSPGVRAENDTAPVVSVTVQNPTVIGGNSLVGRVLLGGPAPAGGKTVHVSFNSDAAFTSHEVTVSAGELIADFLIGTKPVLTQILVDTTATTEGGSKHTKFTILPAGSGQILSLVVTPGQVAGGFFATGIVTLVSPAPAGGIAILLASNNAAAQAPAGIVIPEGQSTGVFSVSTLVVASQQNATLTATSANSVSAPLVVTTGSASGAAIASLTLNPSTVTGGETSTGTVVLGAPAGSGGVVVTLTSSSPSVSVPGSITVPAGQTTATFAAQTAVVGSIQTSLITAAAGNAVSATLTVNPAGPGTGQIASLALNPSTVSGGSPSLGTVTLAAPAPANGTLIHLSSDDGIATVPASITIAGGQVSGTFPIATNVTGSNHLVQIQATSANTATALLTVTANSAGLGTLVGVTLNPSAVTGGQSSTGTVTLASPAPSNGVLVTLGSNIGAASVVSSLIIPSGQTSATFTVGTSPVGSPQVATITATSANTVAAPLTINTTSPSNGTIASLTLNPQSVFGGTPSTGTVTLANPAPANGVLVTLGSNHGSATVPASITIPGGQTSGTFAVATSAVASQQVATISATSANSVSAGLTINSGTPGSGTIQSVTLTPSSVPGGVSSAGTVTLASPAGPSGVSVALSTGSPYASVPGSITIPAGQTTGPFTVNTTAVGSPQTATITATSANTASADLAITTTPPGQGQITGLSLNPTSVVGGSPSTGTVTLANPAPANGILVTLGSNNPVATVPASITIPAGQVAGSFTVNTAVVGSTQGAGITATSANSANANLTITTTPPGQGQIAGVSLNPSSVTGGSPSTGTVTLVNPAPANGVLVTLGSNHGSATVPASVTFAAGQIAATFPVNTSAVGSTQNATITATSANSASAGLTITTTPPGQGQISGLSLNPTSVAGGSPSTGTVTLVNPAPANGILVTLGSNNASATVPASITIAAGGVTGSFTVSTTAPGSVQTATISATSTNAATAMLTINPAAVCVQSLNLNASIFSLLTGDGLITGTVILTGPAPQGGSTVQLLSGNTHLGDVLVPAGQTSVPVNLTVANVATLLGSTIQAVLNGCPLIVGTLTLTPGQSGPAFLTSLTLNPSSLTGATGSATGTVTIASPAAAGGVLVALQSSNTSAVTVPSSVTIPASQTSVSFQMTTAAVPADTSVTISATSSNTLQATFNDKSPCVSGLVLSVKVTNLLTGQGLLSGSVNLSGPAPTGGSTVGLVGLNTNVAVPQGANSAPVSLTVANALTLVGSTVTGVLGSCPGFPVTVQLGL